MAIAVDATSQGYKSTVNTTPLTVSHTCTGSDLMLVVAVGTTFDYVSGVTYNGVAMTQAAKIQDVSNTSYLYYLASPATGANDIVASVSAGSRIRGSACSYTGVDSTIGGTDTDKAGGASVSSLTTTINFTDADGWHIGNCGFQRNPSIGTNSYQRVDGGENQALFDTNGTVGSTGNHSQSYTFSAVTLQQAVGMAIYPAGASTDYPLTASVGAFTLSGIASALNLGMSLVASAGSFVLSGIAVAFARGKGLLAEAGAFVLTGTATAFSVALSLVASTGSFTLTGISAVFDWAKKLVATVANFILTGTDTRIRSSNVSTNVSKSTASTTNSSKSASSVINQSKS